MHKDEHIILYVKTLQLIFYANLLVSKQSDESDWRKTTQSQNQSQEEDDDLDSIRPITDEERQIERLLRFVIISYIWV